MPENVLLKLKKIPTFSGQADVSQNQYNPETNLDYPVDPNYEENKDEFPWGDGFPTNLDSGNL